MQCLICVGSTEFDSLIKELDNEKFAKLLTDNGFKKLIIQTGKGTYEPSNLVSSNNLTVEKHSFVVLDNMINESSLVISHCGAGVLLECLRSKNLGKVRTTNIAVVNETLMGNH